MYVWWRLNVQESSLGVCSEQCPVCFPIVCECVCFVVVCIWCVIIIIVVIMGRSVCEYQSVECAFTSPVSIESGMLVTCRMQYAKYVFTVL